MGVGQNYLSLALVLLDDLRSASLPDTRDRTDLHSQENRVEYRLPAVKVGQVFCCSTFR